MKFVSLVVSTVSGLGNRIPAVHSSVSWKVPMLPDCTTVLPAPTYAPGLGGANDAMNGNRVRTIRRRQCASHINALSRSHQSVIKQQSRERETDVSDSINFGAVQIQRFNLAIRNPRNCWPFLTTKKSASVAG